MTTAHLARQRADATSALVHNLSVQLQSVHRAISTQYPWIHRLTLANYDPRTDLLSALVSCHTGSAPLEQPQARLAHMPALHALATTGCSHVVDDLNAQGVPPTEHARWLQSSTYRSSLTIPLFHDSLLNAFLFFDSEQTNAFTADATRTLTVFAHLVLQLHQLQIQISHGIQGSVRIASKLARLRDLETGLHLERIAAYTRVIATQLQHTQPICSEFIDYLFLFAPLHDIGKVGIPDSILRKPGPLDDDEWTIMRQHVDLGSSIVVQMGEHLNLPQGPAFSILSNIVAQHHERGDGSGYPQRLKMTEIALEARIVAVADVYDALSSQRPYKSAMSEAEVTQILHDEVQRGRLDPDCVQALLGARTERLDIAQRLKDTNTGTGTGLSAKGS